MVRYCHFHVPASSLAQFLLWNRGGVGVILGTLFRDVEQNLMPMSKPVFSVSAEPSEDEVAKPF